MTTTRAAFFKRAGGEKKSDRTRWKNRNKKKISFCVAPIFPTSKSA